MLSGAHFAFVASSASVDSTATLTIRQLDDKTKTRLRVRAAHHGRSMEEEVREILRSALSSVPPAKGNLEEAIGRRFAAFGGLELKLPRRDAMRQHRDLPNERAQKSWVPARHAIGARALCGAQSGFDGPTQSGAREVQICSQDRA
jgi:plasmid stability protein